MPRLARLDAPGVLHRIMIRGIERRKILLTRRDYEDFLDRLATLLPETNVNLRTIPSPLFLIIDAHVIKRVIISGIITISESTHTWTESPLLTLSSPAWTPTPSHATQEDTPPPLCLSGKHKSLAGLAPPADGKGKDKDKCETCSRSSHALLFHGALHFLRFMFRPLRIRSACGRKR